jgi:ABC-type transporter Mla maintaining outer membrane lipid asymmetry ATPase subunit MlaF
VDHEIIKLRDLESVTSIVVTHQLRDAFYIATHSAVRDRDEILLVPASEEKAEEAEFIMLLDGLVVFEGHADQLRRTSDVYLRTFLS